LRNSPSAFTPASCVDPRRRGSFALLALLWLGAGPGHAQTAKSPLLVLLSGDEKNWQAWSQQRGWDFVSVAHDPAWTDTKERTLDQRVKALAAEVEEIEKRPQVDATRVYLAAQGDSASALFYVASRVPDLWAAAVAAGGSPRAAIDSNRLFAANTGGLPVLWLYANKDDEDLARKLKSAGFNLETREPERASPSDALDWLAAHQRDEFPEAADCETGNPQFPRCYWLEIAKFDPAERNDVLDSTRVPPLGSGASLAIGPFGFDSAEPGPGVVIAWLPEKYQGPLKLHDRIIAVGGKELKDSAQYVQLMYQAFEEKPVVVMVARGKEHIRMETRIVAPRREETVTARVRGRYLPDLHEVEILSRAVAQIKLTLPAYWLPAKINWNGAEVAQADSAGCWLLDEQKELLSARKCR